MTAGRSESPLSSFHVLWGAGSFTGWSDTELLARFLAGRDPIAEAAFAALVRRHGPMVLRVCRQVLGDAQVAEDAFQATFVVLARKARSVRHPEALGRWLHGVAVRAARKARSIELREARRARRVDPEDLAEAVGDDRPLDLRLIRRETDELLHQELGRLPEKYRAPVVLCHLEGLTHEEAARRLRWPVGTVGVRLMRARELLRHRLVRRGVAPAATVPAALWAESATAAAVPAGLVEATAHSMMHIVGGGGPAASAPAVHLTRAVLRGLRLARLRAAASLLAAVAVGVATGVSGAQWLSPEPESRLEARALELALRLEPVVEARRVPRPAPDPVGPPRATISFSPAEGHEFIDSRMSIGQSEHMAWVGSPGSAVFYGSYYLDQDESGEAVVTVGHPLEPGSERMVDYRPVLLDKRGRRYLPEGAATATATSEFGHKVAIDRFRFGEDRPPFDAILGVGLERRKTGAGGIERTGSDHGPVPAMVTLREPSLTDDRKASPGCSWVLAPRPIDHGDRCASISGPGGGVVCAISRTRTGVLVIHLAYRSLTRVRNLGRPAEEYRPVLFDVEGGRHVLESSPPDDAWFPFLCQSGPLPRDWSDTAVFRFEVRPDRRPRRSRERFHFRPEDVASIGVERLDRRALREARIASFVDHFRRKKQDLHIQEIRQSWGPDGRIQPPLYWVSPSGRLLWSPFLTLGHFYPGVIGRPLPPDDRPSAWLGAYLILRRHLGQPETTPEALRELRIAEFLKLMRDFEDEFGPHFANLVDTPLLDAYEIARHQSVMPR
jgi:RNA polymerase sigma factor (sigma-70 family)